MWGAIKSDLLSFVTTIQEDTTNTLNRVLGDDDDEEEEDITLQEKLVADLRRSYETYETPIRENDLKDYEKFKKTFSMSSSAAEIARVLDEESEVSRFYAELVPLSMSPEEFWGRLFFRINQIYRNGSANLDLEDDEEELVWEEEEEFTVKTEDPPDNVAEEVTVPMDAYEAEGKTKAGSSQTLRTSSADSSTNTANATSTKGAQTASTSADSGGSGSVDPQQVAQIISLNEHMKERVQILESDNQRLLSHEEELIRKIQELEARLAAQGVAQVVPPIPTQTKASTTPPSKRRTAKSAVSGTASPAPTQMDLSTPPASVEPSVKKKSSTAKKLFDSPAPSPSISPTPAAVVPVSAEPVVAPVAEEHQESAPVAALALTADHVSQSSDESAVVVNHPDNPSDDDLHHHPSSAVSASASAASNVSTTTAPTGKGAYSSQETAKYLAALDDQDEEEDGWN